MQETLTIKVNSVIGTGDPMDRVMLLPLIAQWGAPSNCGIGALMGEDCEEPVTRLYTLQEPVQGFACLSACEAHHGQFAGSAPSEREER